MTLLTSCTLTMPSAEIGPVNPLPPILGDASLDKSADLAGASDIIKINAGFGRVTTIAPYLMQDGYSRNRAAMPHPALRLANDHLVATFLPGLGGRLWSLLDRASGSELLYVNPVFQPANLALRNAWFAGGVEWNIGTIGHTPLTCSPLHAAKVTGPDGGPVLRLYEFERMRRLVYQIDVHLPAASKALFVHVRVTNINDGAVPLYWWSNIAVPQRASSRALAPADFTWNYSYDNVLRHERVAPDGAAGEYDRRLDVSYPAAFADAADFFFDLTATAQPWVASVDGDGRGLFQTSTASLQGRKLFRWGTGPGGRRWQEWLSGPEAADAGGYAEIQAGLAATQFEHLRMPGRAVWSWTEAYGRLDIGEAAARAPWNAARSAGEAAVRAVVPRETLAQIHAHAAALADRAPDEELAAGSGWGALERRLRAVSGEPALDLPGTPFDDATLGAEQRPWLSLLEGGALPEPADGYPASVHLHPTLVTALAGSDGWAAPALHGVALAASGDWGAAATAWGESVARRDNPYAQRNLAVAARREGDTAAMVDHYRRALAAAADFTNGDLVPHSALATEAMEALTSAGEPDVASEALRLVGELPSALRRGGRLRMWEAKAALIAEDAGRTQEILSDPAFEVPDLREGEESLDELFFACQAALLAVARPGPLADRRAEVERTVPLPAHLDFRMKPGCRAAAFGLSARPLPSV